MTVAQQSTNCSPSDRSLVGVINGFQSRKSTQVESEQNPPVKREKSKLRYKQNQSSEIVELLRRSSDSPVVRALAQRIEFCNSDQNLFVADDLHNDDFELFPGRGSLWTCNSRFCSNCVSKLAKTNRKKMRSVMETEKLFVGENWYFLTFTMPNLPVKSLSLPRIHEIMNYAWRMFTHTEKRANKRNTWFQNNIRGGCKSAEFTFTENDCFHFHIHSLAICKTKIQRDNFKAIRQQWTNALKKAFRKFNVKFEINTADALAVVNVKKVFNRDQMIFEICKYVTKSDSWQKLPSDQLAEIAEIERFGRMFEFFGVCRETAREITENRLKTLANENADFHSNVNNDAYLDNKTLKSDSGRANLQTVCLQKPKRRKKWRVRCQEMPFTDYKRELEDEIAEVWQFRRDQLRFKFPFAKFQTLSGETF